VSHWPFIAGAYAVTLVATVGLVVASYAAMRRAEREAGTRRDSR